MMKFLSICGTTVFLAGALFAADASNNCSVVWQRDTGG